MRKLTFQKDNQNLRISGHNLGECHISIPQINEKHAPRKLSEQMKMQGMSNIMPVKYTNTLFIMFNDLSLCSVLLLRFQHSNPNRNSLVQLSDLLCQHCT